jgi:hypothetical protein
MYFNRFGAGCPPSIRLPKGRLLTHNESCGLYVGAFRSCSWPPLPQD